MNGRLHDIEAQIYFLTVAQGGRRRPCQSGYRPQHNFGIAGTLNDASHEYVGRKWVSPGETVPAKLWFSAPGQQQRRLYEGFEFTVEEGNRIVGNGTVTKVLNGELRKRT